MILITGATGELGKLVVEKLHKIIPANQIACLVRDAEKARGLEANGVQIKIGDYNNEQTLETAMSGIETVLLISSNDIINRLNQHKKVIDIAKKSGVRKLVFISGLLQNQETSVLKIAFSALLQTEEYLKASGLDYTILKNTLYMENIAKYIGANVLETGIFFPAGEGKVAFATRGDLAEATAIVLSSTGHNNKTYNLTGSIAYSFNDVAKELSALTGKTIKYNSPEPAVFMETLKQMNIPEQLAQVSLMFATAIKNNDANLVDPTLEKLIGRKTTDLRTYLKQTYL